MHLFAIQSYKELRMSISLGSPCILRSPKTPVKRAGSAIWKDTICLLCRTSLMGEWCTFNVLQHVGLLQKWKDSSTINLTPMFNQAVFAGLAIVKLSPLQRRKRCWQSNWKTLEHSTRLRVTRRRASSDSQRLAQHLGPERNSEAL